MGVRLFFAVLLRESGCFADSFLEFVLRLAQIMEQSSQFSMVIALKVRSESFRPACHADEVFDEMVLTARATVQDAIAFADESPLPDPVDATRDVTGLDLGLGNAR